MYDAVILAGGRARRLGGVDKPALEVAGASLLDRVLAAVADATIRVVVGPPRVLPPGVLACQEQPAGGGPVAALVSGLAMTASPTVAVLGADLPALGPAVPVLLEALGGHDAAMLVDGNGRANYLAAVWSRQGLLARLAGVKDPAGQPMRRLVEGADVVTVPDPEGWGTDCDTWDDLSAAHRRWGAR